MLPDRMEDFEIFRPKYDSFKEVFTPSPCEPLWEKKYREKREKLQAYPQSYGWLALPYLS